MSLRAGHAPTQRSDPRARAGDGALDSALVHEKRIAVAGFAPFGAHGVNPSEQVVRALAADARFITAVLPVAYRRAEAQLVAMLASVRPDALLLLGRHEGESIRLERVALNLDDATSADADGELRSGTPILPAGPVGLWSTLPLDAFAAALTDRALPFAWSRDAGGFLCNTSSTSPATGPSRAGSASRAASCTCRRSRRSRSSASSRASPRASRPCGAGSPRISAPAGSCRRGRRERRRPAGGRDSRCGSRTIRPARSGRSRC